jgi:UDP-2,4-diacetamido-2,4,6-trideoxy-beta-L-altropyranose hydrolase
VRYKVLIRVDANSQIGLGHFTRCLALANMLQDEFDVNFFYHTLTENAIRSASQRFTFVQVNSEEEFLHQVSPESIVVLDGYNFSPSDHREIRKRGARLVCIDDHFDQFFSADLIINHAPNILPSHYNAPDFTQFALGLQYCLLRQSFLKAAREPRTKKLPESTLVICFGGADPKNLTKSALEVAITLSTYSTIYCIVGDAYTHDVKALQSMALPNSNVHVLQSLSEEQMVEKFCQAAVAIVPASGVLIEALAAGARVISGFYADNQKYMYSNYRSLNAFVDAGDFSARSLKDALEQVGQAPTEPGRLIDGKSSERIKKLFRSLTLLFDLKLSKAGIDDLDITYQWASDSQIRRYAFKKEKISFDEHSRWFSLKTSSSKCAFLIASYRDRKIGAIRFDFEDQKVVISYHVDPADHGKGFGSIILSAGIEWLTKNTKGNTTVVGLVMSENIPSIKAFERLGFVCSPVGTHYQFEKKLNYEA